mgnify:CR=1 FL=1
MWWIKSGIENPPKSEVIGRCGGDEITEWPHRTDTSRMLKPEPKQDGNDTFENTPRPEWCLWIQLDWNNAYEWNLTWAVDILGWCL